MTAEKDNKVYTIDESMKEHYISEGYDIRDDDGKLISYGKGKAVPFEEYQKLLQEVESLRKSAVEGEEDEFSEMSVDELKKYASEHEINIGNASTTAGIAKKIRDASRKNP